MLAGKQGTGQVVQCSQLAVDDETTMRKTETTQTGDSETTPKRQEKSTTTYQATATDSIVDVKPMTVTTTKNPSTSRGTPFDGTGGSVDGKDGVTDPVTNSASTYDDTAISYELEKMERVTTLWEEGIQDMLSSQYSDFSKWRATNKWTKEVDLCTVVKMFVRHYNRQSTQPFISIKPVRQLNQQSCEVDSDQKTSNDIHCCFSSAKTTSKRPMAVTGKKPRPPLVDVRGIVSSQSSQPSSQSSHPPRTGQKKMHTTTFLIIYFLEKQLRKLKVELEKEDDKESPRSLSIMEKTMDLDTLQAYLILEKTPSGRLQGYDFPSVDGCTTDGTDADTEAVITHRKSPGQYKLASTTAKTSDRARESFDGSSSTTKTLGCAGESLDGSTCRQANNDDDDNDDDDITDSFLNDRDKSDQKGIYIDQPERDDRLDDEAGEDKKNKKQDNRFIEGIRKIRTELQSELLQQKWPGGKTVA